MSSQRQIDIYLASRSPRRAELLTQIGLEFQTISIDVDESLKKRESAIEFVERLAREKAIAGHQLALSKHIPVVGSDTCICLDKQIIGKPLDKLHAKQILQKLSGRRHEVLTAVAVVNESKLVSKVQTSSVSMRNITEQEIDAYLNTGEPMDKAGAYAIQGVGALFVKSISGSYSGIMGLPLFETAKILQEFEIAILKNKVNYE